MKLKKPNFIIGIIIFFLLWSIVSTFNLVDSFFLPTPLAVLIKLSNLIISGTIIPDLLSTVGKVIISLGISLVVGIPVGLLLGSSKKVYDSLEFVIDFFRSLPAVALFPLFLLIFGIGDEAKIAVTVFGATLIILFNTAHGIKHSNKSRVMAAKLMGATKIQIFKTISFWESLPQTFAGIRITISFTLILILLTEMFIGTEIGLGRRLVDFQYIYDLSGMYAVIILTGIIGYLLNMLFVFLEKKIIHWSGK